MSPTLHATGQHLESKRREEWKEAYIDYKGLKECIKACVQQAETGEASFSPRTTSLTIARYNNQNDSAEERFFTKLEGEVSPYDDLLRCNLVACCCGCLRDQACNTAHPPIQQCSAANTQAHTAMHHNVVHARPRLHMPCKCPRASIAQTAPAVLMTCDAAPGCLLLWLAAGPNLQHGPYCNAHQPTRKR